MIYPSFWQKGNIIGLCAPSNSLKDEDQPTYNLALEKLGKKGLVFVESAHTFGGDKFVSAPAQERAQEFCNLWNNPNIDGIMALAGGEFMCEILPYLQFDKNAKPKWFQGFSDNTVLCHVLLTWLDVASIYHYNFKMFAQKRYHVSVKDSLDCLFGQKLHFESYPKYQHKRPKEQKVGAGFKPTKPVEWKNARKEQTISLNGRLVGGCIDVLLMFLGTPFDKTKQFLQKHAKDGFVWFLESCDLSVPEMKRALWQLKQNGWFEHAKGFVIGRPLFNQTVSNLTYEQAVMDILDDLQVPVIFGADIGHVAPTIPVINGAIANIVCSNGKASISYELK
jgi:muramoyltetrapeptide carboxypeptidase LdcA involved in peptidoglycan recycling